MTLQFSVDDVSTTAASRNSVIITMKQSILMSVERYRMIIGDFNCLQMAMTAVLSVFCQPYFQKMIEAQFMYAGFVSIMALISTSLEKSAPARSSEICPFSCWGLFLFFPFFTCWDVMMNILSIFSLQSQ